MRDQTEPSGGESRGRDPTAARGSGSEAIPGSRRRLLWGLFAVWCAVQAVRVLAEGVARAGARPGSAAVAPHLVDIDRARLAELMLLPGIGPERAEAVVLERVRGGPFGSPEGLLRVPGLGGVTVERLRGWVRAGPDDDGASAARR